MGQTLSEPVTLKETTSCKNETYLVGASCMQGWRITMEDAHTHILTLSDDQEASFFAVYDGHGGAKVAQYAGNHLHKNIVNQPAYKKGDIVAAMKKGFLDTDEAMLEDEEMRDELAGTTAITVLVKNGQIYCGNVGDSRAIACINGHTDPLSLDHKPANEQETKRITAAGGWVEFNRVNGNLALSRALGDFIFKKNDKKSTSEQIVIALPDVQTRPLTGDLEFIVLACDGIWDVMTNEEVVDFVRKRIAKKMDPKDICEELMTRCLAPDCQTGGLGCDNMTVVLVCYLNGHTYEELAERCSSNYQPLSAPAPPPGPPPPLDSDTTPTINTKPANRRQRPDDNDAEDTHEPHGGGAGSPADSSASSSTTASPASDGGDEDEPMNVAASSVPPTSTGIAPLPTATNSSSTPQPPTNINTTTSTAQESDLQQDKNITLAVSREDTFFSSKQLRTMN